MAKRSRLAVGRAVETEKQKLLKKIRTRKTVDGRYGFPDILMYVYCEGELAGHQYCVPPLDDTAYKYNVLDWENYELLKNMGILEDSRHTGRERKPIYEAPLNAAKWRSDKSKMSGKEKEEVILDQEDINALFKKADALCLAIRPIWPKRQN